MNSPKDGNAWMIPEPLAKSVPLVRRRLRKAGLSVIEQFELPAAAQLPQRTGGRSCVVFLVDTPVLMLQAIALDRAAAVFLPLHVVVCGDGSASYVYWANPMTSSGLRPPAPAKGPLESLCARVTEALSEFPRAAGGASPRQVQ